MWDNTGWIVSVCQCFSLFQDQCLEGTSCRSKEKENFTFYYTIVSSFTDYFPKNFRFFHWLSNHYFLSNILEIGYLIVKKIQMKDCKINVQQWSEGDILKRERDFTEDPDRDKNPSL